MEVVLIQTAAQERDEVLASLEAPSNVFNAFLDFLQTGSLHLRQFLFSGHRRRDLSRRDVCFWTVRDSYIVFRIGTEQLVVLANPAYARNIRRELRERT